MLLLTATVDDSTPPTPQTAETAKSEVAKSETAKSETTEATKTEAEKTDAEKAAAVAKDTYDAAHQITTETGKPMVVMVGTDWCGPCQMMKKKILPKVRENGMLQKVAFAVVNADRESDLAKKLTGGGPIPQLVMFRKTPEGWMRRKLVGGQTVESVEDFIKEGLSLDQAEKSVSGEPAQTEESNKDSATEKTTSHASETVDNHKSA
jgi:thioredoxin-like negative regulator of GroEL